MNDHHDGEKGACSEWDCECENFETDGVDLNAEVEKATHAHPAFEPDNCPACGTNLDLETGKRLNPLILHRDIRPQDNCGGQVAIGEGPQALFGTDYWCVYCGKKWSDAKCRVCGKPTAGLVCESVLCKATLNALTR